MAAQPAIDHGTLAERTYEGIRDLIIRGRIPPGERVREAEMAIRFRVSRTPIREALARLVHEGYLAPLSGGRRTELGVTPLDAESVQELWGMIGALEGYAVQAGARLPEERRLAVVEDLRNLNAQLKASSQLRPRDPDRLFELQTAFHVRFVHETAGFRLRNVYDSIRPHVQRYEWQYGTRSDASYEPSTNEHQQIISAIRSGDAVAARSAVEAHWKSAAARTISVIESISRNKPRRVSRIKKPRPRK